MVFGLSGTARAGETAIPSQAFVDSIGVNVHMSYTNTPYARAKPVLDALGNIGIRNVRDGLVARSTRQHTALRSFATNGIGVNLVMGDPRHREGSLEQLMGVLSRDLRGAVTSVEGPNEYDTSGDPTWVGHLRSYQQALYERMKSDRSRAAIPVLGPAPTIGWAPAVGDLSPWMDAGSFHYYPEGQDPLNSFGQVLASARSMSGAKPLIATETGYHDALNSSTQVATSPRAIASYVPRVFLDYFKQGIRRTYLYELIDEWPNANHDYSEAAYGLLRNDLTPKPAATALKNLIGLLQSGTGARSTPGTVSYNLSGDTVGLEHLLLQRPDGRFVLMLWQNATSYDARSGQDLAIRPLGVGVAFSSAVEDVAVTLPSRSSGPVARLASARTLSLGVSDDVMAVQFDSPGSPALRVRASSRRHRLRTRASCAPRPAPAASVLELRGRDSRRPRTTAPRPRAPRHRLRCKSPRRSGQVRARSPRPRSSRRPR